MSLCIETPIVAIENYNIGRYKNNRGLGYGLVGKVLIV